MDVDSEDLLPNLSTKRDFYLEYYSGHQGQFGHEYLSFKIQLNEDGKSATVRYANNTHYRREDRIEKSLVISLAVVDHLRKIVDDSEIVKESDSKWPKKNKDGKQELILRDGDKQVKLETCKIGSLSDVKKSEDPDGLRVFYFLVQDVKALIFSLISLHFKIKPF